MPDNYGPPLEVKLINSEKVAIVDKAFEEEVSCQRWHLSSNGYVCTTTSTPMVYLHMLIMGEKPGHEVDHINGNKLDNRARNLRHVTSVQQKWNQSVRKDSSSGHPGVSRFRGKWEARIKVYAKRYRLGTFSNLPEAVAARKEAERKFYGEYVRKQGVIVP